MLVQVGSDLCCKFGLQTLYVSGGVAREWKLRVNGERELDCVAHMHQYRVVDPGVVCW